MAKTITKPKAGAKSSFVVSTVKALNQFKAKFASSNQPDTTQSKQSSSPAINISWKNIWCAGHWDYSPLQYFLVDFASRSGNPQLLPLEDFDPSQWKILSDKILIRPVWEDTFTGQRVQKVDQLYHHLADSIPWAPLNDAYCTCVPGPHAELGYLLNGYKIIRDEELEKGWQAKKCPMPAEIFLEGGRGSGKSEDFFLVLQRGKPNARADKPEEQCYLNHPAFRVLVLRKNRDDLLDFFDRVDRFLSKHFTITGRNKTEMILELSSGAKIMFGHLADEKAFGDYIGHEYHLIWIEELGLLAKQELYNDIGTCARSGAHSEIIPLVCSTSNPGGPGASWIEDYFINVKDESGNNIPSGTLIYNPVSKSYRIRIHSTVLDNPYTLKTGYYHKLNAITNEAKRLQWLEGSWNVKSGVYFTEFRERRARYCDADPCECNHCEPKHARHVIQISDPTDTLHRQPYPNEPLILGGDIGFTHHAAFVKLRMKSNGQIHATGAKVEAGKTLKQWGVEVAQWIAPELHYIPNQRALLFFSPEAFGNRGMEFTQVQQFNEGVKLVLGKDASIVVNNFTYDDSPESLDKNKQQWMELNQQKQLRLIIRPANNKRIAGWDWLRELLRWESLVKSFVMEYDPIFAAQLINEGKTNEYLAYFKAHQQSKGNSGSELLPKLVINSDCKKIIQGIPKLISDEKKVDDIKDQGEWWNDMADALRYAIMGYKTIQGGEQEAVAINQGVNDWLEKMARAGEVVTPAQQNLAALQAQYQYRQKHQQLNRAGFHISRATGEITVQ